MLADRICSSTAWATLSTALTHSDSAETAISSNTFSAAITILGGASEGLLTLRRNLTVVGGGGF